MDDRHVYDEKTDKCKICGHDKAEDDAEDQDAKA